MTVLFISVNLNGQTMWTLQFPTETICGQESNNPSQNNSCTELVPHSLKEHHGILLIA